MQKQIQYINYFKKKEKEWKSHRVLYQKITESGQLTVNLKITHAPLKHIYSFGKEKFKK